MVYSNEEMENVKIHISLSIICMESVHTEMMDWCGYLPLQSMKVSSNGNNYPPDVPPLFSPFLFSRGSKITSTQAQAHCSLQNKRTK